MTSFVARKPKTHIPKLQYEKKQSNERHGHSRRRQCRGHICHEQLEPLLSIGNLQYVSLTGRSCWRGLMSRQHFATSTTFKVNLQSCSLWQQASSSIMRAVYLRPVTEVGLERKSGCSAIASPWGMGPSCFMSHRIIELKLRARPQQEVSTKLRPSQDRSFDPNRVPSSCSAGRLRRANCQQVPMTKPRSRRLFFGRLALDRAGAERTATRLQLLDLRLALVRVMAVQHQSCLRC